MKIRFIFLLFLFFLMWGSSFSFAQTKVDPLLRILASTAMPETSVFSKALSVSKMGDSLVECFIKTEFAEKVIEKLEAIGGQPGVVLGNVMTARIPIDRLDQIADWEEVEYLEGPKPMSIKMNQARAVTNVDDVQAGTGLDQTYNGSGVVVGIVDTQIDWDHADYNNGSGTSRIYSIWDQTKSGSGVSEISSSTGVECTNAQIVASTCTATADGGTPSTNYHGSHVSGIAAGNDSTYKGAANGADIIFVAYNATSATTDNTAAASGTLATAVAEGVTYIFKKAGALGKAAVVNLSLGTSLGAHDDTSAFESALNTLTSGKKGRAIVNAAGNENFNPEDSGATDFGGIHAAISVASGTDKAVEFAVRTATSSAIVDIWLNSTSTCTIEIDAFKDSGGTAKATRTVNMSALSANEYTTNTEDSNIKIILDFTDDSNAQNSKKHAVGTITYNSTSVATQYSFDVIFRGTCTGDAWLYPDVTATVSFYKRNDGLASSNGYTYFAGDSAKTITIPGTASGVITAGSFMSVPSTWTDKDGTSHDQSGTVDNNLGILGGTAGDISNFSSRGPTADSRTKPEVSAPGEPIISTLASNFKTDFSSGEIAESGKLHVKSQGTSMSAPHVAGTIALLFQKNKCLTTADLKTALQNSADSDSFTGSVPNNNFGYGKLDALGAIQAVSAAGADCTDDIKSAASDLTTPRSTGSSADDTDNKDTTSSSSSKSSCSLHPQDFKNSITPVLVFVYGLWSMVIGRFLVRSRQRDA